MCFVRRLFLCCFTLLISFGCKSKVEPGPILIGHVAPFSGPDKQIGEHGRQAIVLAVEEANKDENRIARRRVAVLHVDSHGDPDALQPEAVRLITVNHVVALLGGVDAAQVERLSHAAQPYDVALITPAAVPAQQMADNVFSVNVSPATRGHALANFASAELKAERVAVLVDGRQTAGAALAEEFNKGFSKPGGRTTRQWVYQSEADLARIINEAKETKPQAVLFAGAPTALQEVGLTVPILAGEDGEQLAALKGSVVYLATPYLLEGATPELQEFVKKYQGRFHESPGTDALLAYDGIRVLVQAMRRAKNISGANAAASVRAELGGSDITFESLTGSLRFDKDHSARRPLFIVRFENGKTREVKHFNPDGQ